MEIIIVVVAIMVYGILVLYHGPWFKIKKQIMVQIQKNGLLHFIDNGLYGKVSDMKGPEILLGKLVWTYYYDGEDSIERSHDFLKTKKKAKENPNMYKVCLRLTGFCNEELKHLYTRIGFAGDTATVFRGEHFKPQNIEVVKRW